MLTNLKSVRTPAQVLRTYPIPRYEKFKGAIPTYTSPDPVKYDNRTWEYVVFQGNEGAAVNLALFLEGRGKKSVVAGEKSSCYGITLQIYKDLFARIPETQRPHYWCSHKP